MAGSKGATRTASRQTAYTAAHGGATLQDGAPVAFVTPLPYQQWMEEWRMIFPPQKKGAPSG